MDRRGYLTTAGVGVIAVLSGCSETVPDQPGSTPPPDSEAWTPKPSVDGSIAVASDATLVVEDHRFAVAEDDARVTGRVVNTDDRSQPVTVTVELFREADAEVAVAEDETNHAGLDAGDRWEFALIFASVEASEIARYSVLTD